jgi:hypothetical protein
MEFMALESARNGDNEYRLIGLFSLRKEAVLDPEAVGPDAYNGAIAENKAWLEVVNANWKRRIVWVRSLAAVQSGEHGTGEAAIPEIKQCSGH